MARSGLLASSPNYISLYDIQETKICKTQPPSSNTLSNHTLTTKLNLRIEPKTFHTLSIVNISMKLYISPLDEVDPHNNGFGSDGGMSTAKSAASMGSGAGFAPSTGIVGSTNNFTFNEKSNVGAGTLKLGEELDILRCYGNLRKVYIGLLNFLTIFSYMEYLD